jgi:RNA polymerase sigma-70 factor (ECF subfamily)
MKDFDAIYKQYKWKVYNYVNFRVHDSKLSEEITNDIFLKVHEFLNVFDPQKCKFETWLYTISRNVLISAIRAEKSIKGLNLRKKIEIENDIENDSLKTKYMEDEKEDRKLLYPDSDELPTKLAYIDKTFESKDLGKIIGLAFEKLKNIEKEVVTLFFIKEMSHQEISDILHITVPNVKVNIFRAKSKLQKYLSTSHVN